MRRVIEVVFGAKAQVVLGFICGLIGIAWWVYIELRYHHRLSTDLLVAAIFRVSMFFGEVACYSIIATGLGFRATERVEAHVADVEHADTVEINE